MPQEPKKRHSKAAKRVRRASIKLTSLKLIACAKCGDKTPSHMVCRSCGFYSGALVQKAKTAIKVTKA
ncbi:50S ribosomal protein L32 [Candidatus Daviesbacteria bacterium RIFCSPHIGHO2_01_FULL_44_29]|uniref:Large ribosomal subunit protein bL32 n=1 Tax=Candidatus Daviesbacteria bacterium RIFCSPHIGHO2_02_FULL_43_12 TaxID=1797776 RepID=A0A1F5KFW2_9BACT|nr:MAG: 50S ribosomal protein L32 [Candidatus Daviesbacteria bacterium RIFCSPHIGHO2_01_FULL_44_29]OGE38832.1 MAG: 50S ribosomal protein L32 [Candidatus Daviesbacteria bacterium RIFCSPHIGHO2_12_FULL_47_45]OGE39729.1 MAG: 50S ribosomal protein L32 [Candidatus Daviesbacteria bacterium RIFCSPHIGHO2_02_FULL_43_12]OGE69980.1 MAG: 50S ribosomal protein L32 [Candidatus Daviesbacteria bacterium RIFCSPLOWO2_01_FULL_43_15]